MTEGWAQRRSVRYRTKCARDGASVHEAHRKVERVDVLGKGADRDAVHAGLRDRAHVFEAHTARGFELGALAGDFHRFAHADEVEVVEEDQPGARIERLAQLSD